MAFGTADLAAEGLITIPVVHVVYNKRSKNISRAQIQRQISVLNKDFRAQNPDRAMCMFTSQQVARMKATLEGPRAAPLNDLDSRVGASVRRQDTERILRWRWVHSHEEGTDEEMVFRPASFKVPPSRGRRSFKLQPDGGLIEGGIAPANRPQESQGTWELDGDDTPVLRPDPSKPPRVMRVAAVEEDRLVTEK